MPTLRRSKTVRNPSFRPPCLGRSVLSESLERRTLLTTLVVNSLSDASGLPNSQIDLRMAVNKANSATSPTTITFDPTVFAGSKTILLSGTALELTNTKQATTITGPGTGLSISGNKTSGVFAIDSGVHASFSSLTATDGESHNAIGSGFFNAGTTTLTNVIVSGNLVTFLDNNINGGGIYNNGMMTLVDVTISGNSAPHGGGMINFGKATLTNVTISGNSAQQGGGIFNAGTATLTNVTISGNSASSGAGITNYQGGNATLNLANSIIASNTGTTTASTADVASESPPTAATINSFGNNLIGIKDGSSGWNATDLTGTTAHPLDPKLGALGNNGGPIQQTMLPQPGSPAIDAGNNHLIPSGVTTDERGYFRTSGGTVDIGAVETQPVIDAYAPFTVSSSGNPFTTNADAGKSANFPVGEFLALSTTPSYTVDVNWGDGSSDTKTTGTPNTLFGIAAQAHTYKKSGTYTLSFTVTDAKGVHSNTASYIVKVVAPQGINSYLFKGSVFFDANKNDKKDSSEKGLAGWEVYADINKDGKLDSGDKTAFTDSSGNYSIGLLGSSGSYTLHEILPTNWSQTTPSSNKGITLTLSSTSTKTGLNFGDYTSIKYLSTVATTGGIVAWWTFDSASQANSILNGYTGTLKGGAKVSTSAGAPIHGESSSSGLSLNGTSAFVNTNLTTQQQFTTAGTYNVWVDLGSTPAKSGHTYVIMAKSQFANDLDLQVESDGKVHFYTDNGTSTSFKPSSLTGWHMVTAEFDTTAKIRKIFWDGKLVATTSPYTGTHSANTGTFAIGESDVFTGRFFDGKIDEVSLFNDALTSSQISAIYNAAKGT